MGEPWLTGPPQVPLQASVNAIPRSAARDAAFPGPVATPARATPVSGSARRACAALVSQAEGEDGGGAGGSTLSPPDQTPPHPQTWTNVAAFPRLVLPGAAKTRQAASVACAGRASELARGVRSVWVRSPGPTPAGVSLQLSLWSSSRPRTLPFQPNYCFGLAPDPVSRPAPALTSAPPLPLSGAAGPSRRGRSLPYYTVGPLSLTGSRLRPSLGPAPSIFQTSSCPLQGPSPVPQLLQPISSP